MCCTSFNALPEVAHTRGVRTSLCDLCAIRVRDNGSITPLYPNLRDCQSSLNWRDVLSRQLNVTDTVNIVDGRVDMSSVPLQSTGSKLGSRL